MLVFDVDWNNSKILHENYYELGEYERYFYIAQPINNNILLVDFRCTNGDENVIIIDYQGNIVKKLCLGDGVQDCIVNNLGNIIVSYFDEGVFSGDGIANTGLNVFNMNGQIIWKSDKPIDDCYAINIDEDENIWYYYYSDFKLIKTNMKEEKIYNPQVSGSSGFLVCSNEKNVIFEGGYDNRNRFVIGKLQNDEIVNFENLKFISTNENINVEFFNFRKSFAVFLDNNNKIFIKKF